MANTGEKKPWDKQPGESKQAFAAFTIYRDLGICRTIPAVVEECSKSASLLYHWSTKWNWPERAEAYDKDVAEAVRIELIQERAAAVKRNLAISRALKGKALEALKQLDSGKLSPRDIKEFLRLSTDLEHQSLYGVASDNELALRREMFEHRKEVEGSNAGEIEDMREIRELVFGDAQSETDT